MIIKPQFGSRVGDFTNIFQTVAGGSILDFYKVNRETGIAQTWGFMPPYMAAYQAQQPAMNTSSWGSIVPLALIIGGVVVLIKVMR